MPERIARCQTLTVANPVFDLPDNTRDRTSCVVVRLDHALHCVLDRLPDDWISPDCAAEEKHNIVVTGFTTTHNFAKTRIPTEDAEERNCNLSAVVAIGSEDFEYFL